MKRPARSQILHWRTSKTGRKFLAGGNKIGKKISSGFHTDVFEIPGNKYFVFKRMKGKVNQGNPLLERDRELYKYLKLGLAKHKIIVRIDRYLDGLIMPRLRVVTDCPGPDKWKVCSMYRKRSGITNKQLEIL